jgi:hypothetical protein
LDDGGPAEGCSIVIFPITAAITILLVSSSGAILHLFVLLVGASKTSASGFEVTFRVVAYASTASVAQIIPFIGA